GLQQPELRANARRLRDVMRREDGVEGAVRAFYKHLPTSAMLCDLDHERVATKWSVKDRMKLCDVCNYVVSTRPENYLKKFVPYRCVDYTARGPDSGFAGASAGAAALIHEIGGAVKDIIVKPAQGYREEGAKGAVIGVVKGIGGLLIRPIHGVALFADHVAAGHVNHFREEGARKVGSVFENQWMAAIGLEGALSGSYATANMSPEELESLLSLVKLKDQRRILLHLSDDDRARYQARFKELVNLKTAQSSTTAAEEVDDPLSSLPDESDRPTLEAQWSADSITVRSARCSSTGCVDVDFSVPSTGADSLDATTIRKWEAFSRAQQGQDVLKQQRLVASKVPHMTICLATIGSWEQTLKQFVALGMRLASDGHRVRVAAHERYRRRITERGLEFFPIAGAATGLHDFVRYLHDAKEEKSIRKRHKRRRSVLAEVREMTFSLWGAAVSADPHGSGANLAGEQFRADALICHPMMFGHVYVAQRLGIPLHCLSLVPLTPTYAFPHVLSSYFAHFEAEIHWEPRETNWLSHGVVDAILWNGIVDVLSEFRSYIGLPGRPGDRPSPLIDWEVPVTYCWNPVILSKPMDWGSEISIAGWFSLNDELEQKRSRSHLAYRSFNTFVLETGNPVIYVGVSNSWDNELDALRALLTKIDDAAQQANVRVLFQRERVDDSDSDSGGDDESAERAPWLCYQSDHVYEVDADFSFDAILRKVRAVVHWGDPGMLADGLAAGKPTCVCPQLSTQYFSASVCVKAGVGVAPIRLQSCSSADLAAKFRELLDVELAERVMELAGTFSNNEALENAAEAFYANLPLPAMVCDLDERKLARVYDSFYDLKLSFEAYLAVRSLREHNGAEDVSYRPLHYDGKGPPKYSLRGIRGEMQHAGEKAPKHPNRAIGADFMASFAALGHGPNTTAVTSARTLLRTVSLFPVVEERPAFWHSEQEEHKAREEIHAAYERALAHRAATEKKLQRAERRAAEAPHLSIPIRIHAMR
ncbi:hypothetical protein PybrP1_012061, partial [[Pythium] brassicae (nom. inval.)]